MATLSREYRRQLERVIIEARQVGEKGAKNALKALAVEHHEPLGGSSQEQRDLRNRLRAHGRQLGDKLDPKRGSQTIDHLASECAYEHWHRMLFARFLAENNLLIEPGSGVALSLDDCRELAREKNTDWLELASTFAVRMLPQIFRLGDPALEVSLPPESRKKLEELLESLPADAFTTDDSLGWVYQFWQSEEKKRVNDSGEKIGADELPAVTQLFTEDYMVLFLLHNTLGAWWTAKRKSEGLGASLPGYDWTYLRMKADGSPAAGSFVGWPRAARDLKVLDPSMGSGHFLVFALPILVRFRMEEEGLSLVNAVQAVVRDNLYGLELDSRCTQIAAFNLAFAAWRMCGGVVDLPQLNLACSGLGINAKEDDWLKLAGEDSRALQTMQKLYALFKQAPVLGSLIDPTRVEGTLFSAGFGQVRPLLEKALENERTDLSEGELAVAALGVVHATKILADNYTLVVTNVPYLGRGRQSEVLKEYCDKMHDKASADLAVCMLERCVSFVKPNGTAALVTPQNWMYIGPFRRFRKALLTSAAFNFVVPLGTSAFETISGEIVNVNLSAISVRRQPDELFQVDVSAITGTTAKGEGLQEIPLTYGTTSDFLRNPDHRITLSQGSNVETLQSRAGSFKGIATGDINRFIRSWWECGSFGDVWSFFQGSVSDHQLFGGRHLALRWEKGCGSLHEYVAERLGTDAVGSWIRGDAAWKKRGIAISQMAGLSASLYFGDFFDENTAAIIPSDPENLAAIWCYCTSDDYKTRVRSLDSSSLKVPNLTLLKVPFDLSHWKQIAAEQYPTGLPSPSSENPTQWLFGGAPHSSEFPMQVGVCRLVGYKWPRQAGCNFMDCPALVSDGLERHSDEDGIVCMASIQGEAAAADRLRALLADAYGAEWSGSKLSELLSQVGFAGRSLEDWLRDGFFAQHCELFHQRPFVWHIWDGLRDGFHAFVNYHKLAAPSGVGRQTLEKLIYTYLGDWIDRQKADQKNGVEGADARVAAAVHLQTELKKIVKGEPPYDIFVRWKPLHEQPIGWEPDINDGVRLNIRPFVTAKALNGRGKGSSILRVLPKGIKWDKDRGKEPHRAKEEFPWFWSWDESTEDFAGGREFDGNRWNDLHYSIQAKKDARDRHNKAQSRKGAAK